MYIYIYYIVKDESFWCFDWFFAHFGFFLLGFWFLFLRHQQKLITSRC